MTLRACRDWTLIDEPKRLFNMPDKQEQSETDNRKTGNASQPTVFTGSSSGESKLPSAPTQRDLTTSTQPLPLEEGTFQKTGGVVRKDWTVKKKTRNANTFERCIPQITEFEQPEVTQRSNIIHSELIGGLVRKNWTPKVLSDDKCPLKTPEFQTFSNFHTDAFENARKQTTSPRGVDKLERSSSLFQDNSEYNYPSFAPSNYQSKHDEGEETRVNSLAHKYLLELQISLDGILQNVGQMTIGECKIFAVAEHQKTLLDFDSEVCANTMDQNMFQQLRMKFIIEAKLIHDKFVEKILLVSQKTANVKINPNLNHSLDKAIADATEQYQKEIDTHKKNMKNGYFADSELQQINKDICSRILSHLIDLYDLNSIQRNQLEEALSKLSKKFKNQNVMVKQTFSDDIAIGIELGMTYCCVAAYIKGKVQVVENGNGKKTTPSYVLINDDGTTVVGSAAKDKAFRNPESTIYDAKRIIGRRPGDPKLQEDLKFWPFNVKAVGNELLIEVHGKDYHPEEISAMVLKHLKEEAQRTLGMEIKKAVITVPACFSDGQRLATIKAGELAGLEVLGLLNEPTAAALAYRLECYDVGHKRNILVYGFGGGTFDASVLSLSDGQIEVLGTSGDAHLGGDDIDKNLMKYCAVSFQRDTGIDLFEGKDDTTRNKKNNVRRRLHRLLRECERTKKSISGAHAPSCVSDVSVDTFADGKDLVVELPRELIDAINFNLYSKTIEITENALISSNLTPNDIGDVVMVGGTSRIKKVQELVSDYFGGKTLCNRLDPDGAIAIGAAVFAASLNITRGQKLLDFGTIQEITPKSIGVQLRDKSMDIVIPRCTKIPTTHTKGYKTHKDGQTSVMILIYEGEDENTEANTLLGTFNLKGIPSGPAGSGIVDVTMTINMNGILSVEAVCRSTKGKTCLTISDDRGGYKKAKEKLQLAEAP